MLFHISKFWLIDLTQQVKKRKNRKWRKQNRVKKRKTPCAHFSACEMANFHFPLFHSIFVLDIQLGTLSLSFLLNALPRWRISIICHAKQYINHSQLLKMINKYHFEDSLEIMHDCYNDRQILFTLFEVGVCYSGQRQNYFQLYRTHQTTFIFIYI